jgi:F-type H+-transporting ATPase subunit gamma
MAVGKEIRGKIKSVENTKKITKAMEMVAASQDAQGAGAHACGAALRRQDPQHHGHLSQANPEYKLPYMRDVATPKAVGFIVVTTDKGLCGGLNTNVLRAVTTR